MNRRLTILFAVAGGAAVGNLYWCQPLLHYIAADLGVDTSAAGWLVTVTQLGYAVGILLFVPLGDLVNRRILVPVALLCAALALLAAALAPSFGLLLVALAAVGVTTIAGQVLIPLAGDLADDADRGRVVGTVVSGVLIGILLSRTLSGLVADVAGWRAIYIGAAALSAILSVTLYVALPTYPPRVRLRYPVLVGSVFAIVRRERSVRWSLLLGGTAFAVFTMFWTALTFLLSAPPFNLSVTAIGLFGLVGLAGALAAQRAGRLSDRGFGLRIVGGSWVLVLVALVIAGVGARSAAAIIVAVVILDIAIQALNITVQSRLFQVDPRARSRLNTAFVTNNFVFGAVGSGLASFFWNLGGWTAVVLAGTLLAGFALTVWGIGRSSALRTSADC